MSKTPISKDDSQIAEKVISFRLHNKKTQPSNERLGFISL